VDGRRRKKIEYKETEDNPSTRLRRAGFGAQGEACKQREEASVMRTLLGFPVY
jgi:hypothetical protein